MMRNLHLRYVAVLWIIVLAVLVTPLAAQTPTPSAFPLAERGPYAVGVKNIQLTDDSRDGRVTSNFVWYPAIAPENATQQQQDDAYDEGWLNALPDLQGASYPLILFSPGWNQPPEYFSANAIPLASRGFVVVSIGHPQDRSPLSFVDRPLDVLFTLDQLSSNVPSELAGLIDTDHVGVMGFSFGAYTAMALSGARIDPVAVNSWTAQPLVTDPVDYTDPRTFWPDWNWEAIEAYRSQWSPPLQDGEMWPAFTDSRIQAVIMVSCGWMPMFGENGLAAATVPTFMFAGTEDASCPYEATYTVANLGSQDRYLLTVVGGGHGAGLYPYELPATIPLEAAFFNKYLRDQPENEQYLTADYVDSVEAQLNLGLVWGLYTAP
jgi:predicted dienelactone hydrolase